MLVWMKALASSIERSAWLSAAKLTTAVGRFSANRRRTARRSAMSPPTKSRGGGAPARPGPLPGEQPGLRAAVGDVPLDEIEAGVVQHVRQARQAAGVGELVEHHDAGVRLGEEEPHEVAADEAGAAGDEDGFHGAGSIALVSKASDSGSVPAPLRGEPSLPQPPLSRPPPLPAGREGAQKAFLQTK